MKVNYNKSTEIAEAHLETKDGKPVVFRFKYMGDEVINEEDKLIDCETVCPLAKAGINCEELAHSERKRKGFADLCAEMMIKHDEVLPPEQVLNEKSEEMIKSSYFLPVLDKDFKEYYNLSI